jgi:hypothetical protein
MQALVWWTVPLAGFLLALVWVSVRNRPRPPADPHDSMAEHERFRQAMEAPVVDPAIARSKSARGRHPRAEDGAPENGDPPGGS